MGGATIWPVPRAMDAEAHYYPRMWKRNMFFLYGSMILMGFQFQRYAWMCRVSSLIIDVNRPPLFSNQLCESANTWIGAADTNPRESDTPRSECSEQHTIYLTNKHLTKD